MDRATGFAVPAEFYGGEAKPHHTIGISKRGVEIVRELDSTCSISAQARFF